MGMDTYSEINDGNLSKSAFRDEFDVLLTKEVIRFLAWMAAKDYGNDSNGRGGVFSSATFSSVVSKVFGLPALDGYVVKLILSGRDGITQLQGGCHWRVRNLSW